MLELSYHLFKPRRGDFKLGFDRMYGRVTISPLTGILTLSAKSRRGGLAWFSDVRRDRERIRTSENQATRKSGSEIDWCYYLWVFSSIFSIFSVYPVCINDLRSGLCRVKYFAHKNNWKQWTSGGANVKAWMLFLVIVEKYVMSLLSTSRLASAVLLAVEWT